MNRRESLRRQVEDQKEETKRLEERQRGLAETIKSLEKDIQVRESMGGRKPNKESYIAEILQLPFHAGR